MWATILQALLPILLPALSQLLDILLAQLRQAQLDDPTVVNVTREICAGIDRDWPDLSDDERRHMAVDALRAHLTRKGLAVPRDVVLNTFIELAVLSLRAGKTA